MRFVSALLAGLLAVSPAGAATVRQAMAARAAVMQVRYMIVLLFPRALRRPGR